MQAPTPHPRKRDDRGGRVGLRVHELREGGALIAWSSRLPPSLTDSPKPQPKGLRGVCKGLTGVYNIRVYA